MNVGYNEEHVRRRERLEQFVPMAIGLELAAF